MWLAKYFFIDHWQCPNSLPIFLSPHIPPFFICLWSDVIKIDQKPSEPAVDLIWLEHKVAF